MPPESDIDGTIRIKMGNGDFFISLLEEADRKAMLKTIRRASIEGITEDEIVEMVKDWRIQRQTR